MDVHAMVEGYRTELLERLSKLVAINSREGTPTPDAPFGEGPRKALDTALKMMADDGFKTVDLDHYIGYAEMGEGKELIGVVGHLDIVPANKEDGWDTDPFVMTEKDGIVYGRGVADDKGAVVASMIAMKVIRDMGIPVNKRVRLIMGTNEETGSKCLHHYVEKEGSVDYGFTPDGDFPGIHGEKGMVAAVYRSKKTGIRAIKGGTARNVVCPKCTAEVDKCSYSRRALEDYFNSFDLEYTITDKEATDEITLIGTAAHASLPELGVNAISYLLCGLKKAGYQDPFVDFYCSHFGTNYDGTGVGLNVSDEYGALTLNNGVISMEDGVITGSIDIRFPVTYTAKQIVKMFSEHLEDDGGVIEIKGSHDPLFFPADSPLVKLLLEAYQEVTGDMETQPMTIGGGTYAKSIDNTIAFGCAFPGKDYRIHNTNEWCPVDELLLQAEIYVSAIIKLLNI
ncbi:MAG: Sapep family Mn(2+)-dependent dipeptidase [Solobacterium sp.]|nr:Sapep family Mn(2+)-dependent dipeptidase [Solobacterium sp.]